MSQCNFKEQQTITQVLQKAKKYIKQDPQYKCITKKVAVFVVATSIPNSIVENAEFCSLLEDLDG